MDIWEEIGQLMLEAEKTAEFVGRANKETIGTIRIEALIQKGEMRY